MSNYLISKRKYENDMKYGVLFREIESNKSKNLILEEDCINYKVPAVSINSNLNFIESENNVEKDDDDSLNDKLIEEYFKQKTN